MKIRFLSLLLFFLPFTSPAQTGIYASFSASNFDLLDIPWQFGPTIGVYHDFAHASFLSAGADLRGSFVGFGSSKTYSGLIGPHVQIRPHVLPLQPYFEGLVGIGHVEYGQASVRTDATKFTYQLVAGIDLTIFPHFDWRVAEFSFGGFTGLEDNFHPKTLSMGFVLRLP
jgi:hypothetical protein